MNTIDALDFCRKHGCTVEQKNGTGEVRITPPTGRSVLTQHWRRRKDASAKLIGLVRRLEREATHEAAAETAP